MKRLVKELTLTILQSESLRIKSPVRWDCDTHEMERDFEPKKNRFIWMNKFDMP